jgi:hypothetical protein
MRNRTGGLSCVIAAVAVPKSEKCQKLPSAAVPDDKRKRPGNRGAPKMQLVRASGSDLGRLHLQKPTGACNRDRPRLHRLRDLAHELDV